MSNIIPPLISNSPPPIVGPLDEEDDDDFGDFRAAHELSYSCDNLSLPSSPFESPKKSPLSIPDEILDINSNKNKQLDRRKDSTGLDDKAALSTNAEICDLENSINDKYSKQNVSVEECEQDVDLEVEEINKPDISKKEFVEPQSEKRATPEGSDARTALENGCEDSLSCSKTPELNKEETIIVADDNFGEFLKPPDLEETSIENNDLKKSISLNQDELTDFNSSLAVNPSDKDESESFADFVSSEELPKSLSDDNVSDDEFGKFESPFVESTPDVNSAPEELPKIVSEDNEFGKFETPIEEPPNRDDDFKNFETPAVESIQDVKSATDDDDFGDFETAAWDTKTEVKNDDAFADFATASTSDADNFGNFANFDEPSDDSIVLNLDKEKVFEKTESILKEIFPSIMEVPDEVYVTEITQGDSVFNELKDVTETNALIYQWSKSASQSILLKSLNIDTRNILYGPAWNPSMPIFAANLGLTPLEPIKPEIITPTPVQKVEINPSSSSQSVSSTNNEIPSAQFDWTGSGLINPLDYSQTMLLDLEQLVATLDIPSCNPTSNSNNSSSPNNELDDWDLWLQSVSAKEETVEVKIETNLESNVGSEKSDYPVDSQRWSNIVPVPLRETHISNDESPISSEGTADVKTDFGWLQPTIVTPELPRKDIVQEQDDDFDDFQMSVPERVQESKVEPALKTPIQAQIVDEISSYKGLESSVDDFDVFGEFEVKSKPNDSMKTSSEIKENFSGLKSSNSDKTDLHSDSISSKIVEPEPVTSLSEKQVDEEDEFTDFHSSAPPMQPLQPVQLEPLQPSILMPQTSLHSQPMQINWPDPGISDEDIKRFEMSFNRPLDAEPENPVPKKPEPVQGVPQSVNTNKVPKSPPKIQRKTKEVKPIVKDKSLEDDEWSDFVSVQQQPSPLHKINFGDRTASPDLPLSVLNLGNLQPTRQPIPVITPQGLMQTKLSSKTGATSKQQYNYNQPTTALTNSFISNQYAATHLFNTNGFPSVNGNSSGNPQVQNNLDDDDWSDFISSPLPQTNGYTDKTKVQSPPNPSPNIITNPSHFHGFQPPKKSTSDSVKAKHTSVQSKSTISSISTLPDLDYIAPKGWTNRK